jgi:hypothetical protein
MGHVLEARYGVEDGAGARPRASTLGTVSRSGPRHPAEVCGQLMGIDHLAQ